MANKIILISDFNLSNFAGCLINEDGQPQIETVLAPFGQVMQTLMDSSAACWHDKYNSALIWTRPEAVVESFYRVLMNEPFDKQKLIKEVDVYAQAVQSVSAQVETIIVPTWVAPTYQRCFGPADMKHDLGITNILMQMNLRLAESFSNSAKIHLLNTQRWVENSGKGAFNPKLWYMGKIMFDNEVFREASRDVGALLNALAGLSRKLIILDLDDTLWGGVIGDLGRENVALGGHDPIGEAYVDFQKTLKSLSNRGILLGIVSKNEENVAVEAIKNHPEMVLKIDDFAGWRINWQDKAKNISDLVSSLNLGLESVVFIDDSPLERARIREALPQVLVPDLPAHPLLYKSFLLGLRCFDAVTFTQEDASRSKMYAQEAGRRSLQAQIGSLDEWIKNLNIKVAAEELLETNLTRAAQLFNKTNQMNLATRRLSQDELLQWQGAGSRKIFVFKVSDKFGDYGLTGITSLSMEEDKVEIVDFVLSCRVMGRHVEKIMLHVAVKYAVCLGAKQIYARYRPTEKNKPCLEFWKDSGFDYDKSNFIFSWPGDKVYPASEGVTLEEAFNER
ncbi:MAG: HAD-IIIC family phosphatase [Candidatus Omnitrophota bacterium]|nr:HAD-IIIC family phosphatase [Candidatus Omnitrophota bacterium]